MIDSLQLTANHKVATPAQWQQGDDVIIAGSVTDDEAQGDLPGRLGVAEALHPDRAAADLTGRGSSARLHVMGELAEDRQVTVVQRAYFLAKPPPTPPPLQESRPPT